MSDNVPILKDSIFDEDEFEDLRIPKAYRLIGILRLIWILILTVALLRYIFFQFNFSDDAAEFTGNLIGLCLVGSLFTMISIYHINQLRVDIRLSQDIITERKFRVLSVFLQMLFLIVALWSLVTKDDLKLNPAFLIQLLWTAILFTILIVDLDYYVKRRKKTDNSYVFGSCCFGIEGVGICDFGS